MNLIQQQFEEIIEHINSNISNVIIQIFWKMEVQIFKNIVPQNDNKSCTMIKMITFLANPCLPVSSVSIAIPSPL
jgi:hypothetical protein